MPRRACANTTLRSIFRGFDLLVPACSLPTPTLYSSRTIGRQLFNTASAKAKPLETTVSANIDTNVVPFANTLPEEQPFKQSEDGYRRTLTASIKQQYTSHGHGEHAINSPRSHQVAEHSSVTGRQDGHNPAQEELSFGQGSGRDIGAVLVGRRASPPDLDRRASREKRERSASGTTSRRLARLGSEPRGGWQIQKDALSAKFGSAGWRPMKRLSPDALEGIRELHAQQPDRFTTPMLAENFQISPEAVRRILKSKWKPSEEEEERRRQRWEKRGSQIWTKKAEVGIKPPKKWRDMGVHNPGFGPQNEEEVPWSSDTRAMLRARFDPLERQERHDFSSAPVSGPSNKQDAVPWGSDSRSRAGRSATTRSQVSTQTPLADRIF